MSVTTWGRPVRPGGWWFDAVLVAGFAAVTALLALPGVRNFDLAVRDFADAHRPALAQTVAEWFNRLGNGGPLTGTCLLIALILVWRRRSPWPLAPVVAAFLATGFVIQPLKLYFCRAAPHSVLPDADEVRLFSQPGFGLSYPSGHAVNTIVWYGVIALLLAGWFNAHTTWRRVLRLGPPIIVGFTATYLGYHWITDMVAGVCLGLLIDRLLARVPWPKLTP